MEISPRISVVMSVYNGEKYLKEAIDSVLSQSFKDFEFIIYDDCSTDGSVGIIENYHDERIKLIKNETNKGLTLNLIDGINSARGKYLARMDADDICLLDRFQKQLDFFEKNPEISILGSSVIYFHDNGSEFIAYQPTEHDEIMVQLLLGFTLLHPSVMMRIEDLRKYHLNYNPEYRYAQDHDLWVRAGFLLKLGNIKEPLIKMREHKNKISTTLKPEQQFFSNKTRNLQLQMYQMHMENAELQVFHDYSSGCVIVTKEKLKRYENALLKILDYNSISRFLNHEFLKHRTSQQFREICRGFIIEGYPLGLYYWSSKIKCYDNASILSQIKLLSRSIKLFYKYILK